MKRPGGESRSACEETLQWMSGGMVEVMALPATIAVRRWRGLKWAVRPRLSDLPIAFVFLVAGFAA